MRSERVVQADDRACRPAELSRLGARVLEMANLATAIHMRERLAQALREAQLDVLGMRHE